MITVQEFKKFPDRTFGLGQDVSTNLLEIVKVPALFIQDSKLHKDLIDSRLKSVTLDVGAPQEIYDQLLKALQSTSISNNDLVTIKSKYGRKPYASGLIRAIYDGQKGPAILDWPAKNYLAVAVGMGLVDLNYDTDQYYVTELGKKAVSLLDADKEEELQQFMLDRLFEYPYAAWLIRLVNQDKKKAYSKFDLGENFGFIDEPGFSSLPEDLYVDAMIEAVGDSKKQSKIRGNYESTADKYMRWLAGVLVDYKLLKRVDKKYSNGIKVAAYKVTLEGTRALNRVNGGSRFHRSVKRVRWEYLAPKVENASKRKTARALMIKYLSEASNGLDATTLSNQINKVVPSINSIPEQVLDDAIGLNRLGIEIEIKDNHLQIKDRVYDFVIPVKKNHTFTSNEADKIKQKILPRLKHVNHKYLQAIDIAYKKRTSNLEDTLLEVLSTELFTEEMEYDGKHLGGSNKPDGFVFDDNTGWILDAKAYSSGFAATVRETDAMGRYISQYRDRNDKSTWWQEFHKKLPNVHFAYISSFYVGHYKKQLIDFENRNKMTGALIEVPKLILLAEKYKDEHLSHDQITSILLNNHILFDQYIND